MVSTRLLRSALIGTSLAMLAALPVMADDNVPTKRELGPVLIDLQNDAERCLAWPEDIVDFVRTVLERDGFATVDISPDGNYGVLKIQVVAWRSDTGGPCTGSARIELERFVQVGAGLEERLPVLLVPGNELGPGETVDTDLASWLSSTLPELAAYLPD